MSDQPTDEELDELLAQIKAFAGVLETHCAIMDQRDELDLFRANSEPGARAIADAQAFLDRVTGRTTH